MTLLGTTLLSPLIVGAYMAETRASAATWLGAIALEFPPSTYLACQSFLLWGTRVHPSSRTPCSLFGVSGLVVLGLRDHHRIRRVGGGGRHVQTVLL